MVNSKDIGCVYDPDLETYKLTSLRKLKDTEREKLTISNRRLNKTFAAYSRYVDVNKDSLAQANKQWDGLLDSILAASANHVTTVSMEELIFAN